MLFGSPDALWIRISKDAANRLTYDKTVTNEEAVDSAELKELLIQKGHPIVKMAWKNGEINQLRSYLGASPAVLAQCRRHLVLGLLSLSLHSFK